MVPHEVQMQLHALSHGTPLSITLLSIWPPGKAAEQNGAAKPLTGACCMTGFANGVPLQEPIVAEPAAMAAFGHIFTPSGSPRLTLGR